MLSGCITSDLMQLMCANASGEVRGGAPGHSCAPQLVWNGSPSFVCMKATECLSHTLNRSVKATEGPMCSIAA